jgi:hypothetical protein
MHHLVRCVAACFTVLLRWSLLLWLIYIVIWWMIYTCCLSCWYRCGYCCGRVIYCCLLAHQSWDPHLLPAIYTAWISYTYWYTYSSSTFVYRYIAYFEAGVSLSVIVDSCSTWIVIAIFSIYSRSSLSPLNHPLLGAHLRSSVLLVSLLLLFGGSSAVLSTVVVALLRIYTAWCISNLLVLLRYLLSIYRYITSIVNIGDPSLSVSLPFLHHLD